MSITVNAGSGTRFSTDTRPDLTSGISTKSGTRSDTRPGTIGKQLSCKYISALKIFQLKMENARRQLESVASNLSQFA